MIILIFLICSTAATTTVNATEIDTVENTSSNDNNQRDSIKSVVDHLITVLEKIQLETIELEARVPNLRPLWEVPIGGEGSANRNLTFEEVANEIDALKSEMENLKFTNNIQKLLINIEKDDRDKNDKLLMRWVFNKILEFVLNFFES